MKNIVYTFIVFVIVDIVSALFCGIFMWLGNGIEMVNRLYAHFGIANLSFLQYVVGSFFISSIIECIFPHKIKNGTKVFNFDHFLERRSIFCNQ